MWRQGRDMSKILLNGTRYRHIFILLPSLKPYLNQTRLERLSDGVIRLNYYDRHER